MSRSSPERRARSARRARSLRGFIPAVLPLESRQLMAVAAPLGLTATPAGNDRINLAWTDASTNEQGFKVERSTDGVTFAQVGTVGANQTSYAAGGLAFGTAYQFRVRAYDASGDSPNSSVASATTTAVVPVAPAGLTAAASSSSQVNLAWADTSDNEQGFKVERSSDGVTFTQIGTAYQNGTSYADGNLTPGATYSYRVRAYNAAGDSPYSSSSGATTLLLNAPSNLSAAVASGTQVNLTWYDYSANETGFKVERSADGVNFVEVATAPAGPYSYGYAVTYQVTGLTPGTAYQFRVRAYNAQGVSAYSNASVVRTSTAPAAPGNLTATIAANDRINLAWTDYAVNEQGYKVEQSSDGVTFTQIGTTSAGQTSYAASNLVPGTRYSFRVRAYNGDDSAYSAVASATTATVVPAAPLNLTAAAQSGSQVNLAWANDSDNVQGYKVERSTDGATFTQIAALSSYTASYQATGLSPLTTYTFRVRASNAAGDSAPSNTATATTTALLPAAPSGVTATALSNTEIDLRWVDNSDNEQYFRIERSTDGTNFAEIASVGANQVAYRAGYLTAGTQYYFRVRASNASGYSGYSAAVSVSTLSVNYPTNLVAAANSPTQVTLTWSDNNTDEQGYKVERSTDGVTFTQIGTAWANQTSYGDYAASAGVAYTYRVRAYNAAGNSAYSNAAAVTTPAVAAPSYLSATPASSTQINLGWYDYSTNEQGFKVERSADGVTFTQVGTTAANQATFQATGLTPGITYSFRVRAYNAQGDSAYSNVATAMPRSAPAAPSGLTATPAANDRINLAWTDYAVNEQGYKVERSADGVTFTQIGTTSANQTTYTASNLGPGARSYFRVRAYNTEDSAYSNVADATTTSAVPDAPATLTAVASSSSQVNLAWADTSDNEQGFKVERSSDGVTFTQIGTAYQNGTSYADGNLTPGATYSYRVRAYNAAGDSPYSSSSGATTLLLNAPSNLSAAVASGTQVNLTWYDYSANETGFKVERSADGVNFVEVATAPAGPYSYGYAVTYQVTGLTPGTAYSFRVRGTNAAGNSTYSNVASARTSTAPSAPGNLTATPASNSQINLAWTDVATNEQGYKIERSSDGVSFTQVATVGANQTSYAAGGLAFGATYSFRVRAYNGDDSAYSNVVNAVPAAIRPAAPANLAATVASNVQINLSWSDTSDNEDGYKVERSNDGVTFVQVGTVAAGWYNPISFQATGLAPATTYQFRVRSYNAAGDSDPSAAIGSTTAGYPVAPAGLTAAALSASEIRLAWQDVGNEAGYKVERSPNGSSWTQVGTVGADVTSYTDSGLSDSTSYSYRVLAYNAAGNSPYSTTASAVTPLASPANVSAAFVTGGRIDVTWADRSGAESSYYVEQSPDGTSGWRQVGSVGANATSFSAPGPFNPSTPYYFRVRAYNYYAVYSAYSPTAVVTTPAFPLAPTVLTAAAASDTSINVTWSDVANEDVYRIERSADGSTWALAGTVGAGVTSFADAGLQEAKLYYYRVAASNAQGESAPSAVRNAYTPPAAPSGLTATVVSGGRIDLAWTDRSGAESAYYIEQSPDGTTGWVQVGAVVANATSFSAPGPFSPSTPYYFRVRAYSYTGGYSAYSASSVTTPAFPNRPTGVTATATSDTAVTVSWTDLPNETGYRVERQAGNGAWTAAGTVAADVTSYADSGLTEATRYSYRIVALNAAGDSAPSALAGATTRPAAPTGLSASAISSTQIGLSWTDRSSGETGFRIEQAGDASGPWTQVGTTGANVNAFTATGPFDGLTTYYFRVSALSASGASATASASTTTGAWPNFPRSLAAVAVSPTRIDLTWAESVGATGYVLERSPNASVGWATIATLGVGETSYSDITVAEATTYYYRLRATNASGASGYSPVIGKMTLYYTPTVATPAAANPATVTGTTTSLSVLGAVTGGESKLRYSWSVVAQPAGSRAPTFSASGTNAAKAVTATFYAAGSYTFRATITNGDQSVTSDVVVAVEAMFTGIAVTSSRSALHFDDQEQFTATAQDQFGNALATQPEFTWSLGEDSAGGISADGLFTAQGEGAGVAAVRASANGVTGVAAVDIGIRTTYDFEDLAVGTAITDQYSFATFSADSGKTNNLYDYITGHAIGTGPVLPEPARWGNSMYVDFRTPVEGLKFTALGDDQSGTIGRVKVVMEDGSTANVNIQGDGNSSTPAPVDLSRYRHVKRIELSITDVAGLWWDDFSFLSAIDLTAAPIIDADDGKASVVFFVDGTDPKALDGKQVEFRLTQGGSVLMTATKTIDGGFASNEFSLADNQLSAGAQYRLEAKFQGKIYDAGTAKVTAGVARSLQWDLQYNGATYPLAEGGEVPTISKSAKYGDAAVRIRALDRVGNAVPGATVLWSDYNVNAGSASADPWAATNGRGNDSEDGNSSLTDADGYAKFVFSAEKVPPYYEVAAIVDSLAQQRRVQGKPIRIVAGMDPDYGIDFSDPQTNRVMYAVVTDDNGPVSGVTVTFWDQKGLVGVGATAVTDASGRAQVPVGLGALSGLNYGLEMLGVDHFTAQVGSVVSKADSTHTQKLIVYLPADLRYVQQSMGSSLLASGGQSVTGTLQSPTQPEAYYQGQTPGTDVPATTDTVVSGTRMNLSNLNTNYYYQIVVTGEVSGNVLLNLGGGGTYAGGIYSFTPTADGKAEIMISTTAEPVRDAQGQALLGVGRKLQLQLQSTKFPYLPPSAIFNPWVPVTYGSGGGVAQQALVVADGMSIIRARQAANLAGRVAWGAVAGSDTLGPEMAGDIALGLTPGIGVYTDIRDVAKNLVKFLPVGLGSPDKQELAIAALGILTEFLPPVDYVTDAYRTVYKLAKGAAQFAPLLVIMEPLFDAALHRIWDWAKQAAGGSFFGLGVLDTVAATNAILAAAGGDAGFRTFAAASAPSVSPKQFNKFLESLGGELSRLPKWLDFISGMVKSPENFTLLGRMLKARGGAVMLESLADIAHKLDPDSLFDALRKADADLTGAVGAAFSRADIDYMLPAAIDTLRKSIDGAEAGDLAAILKAASPDDFAGILGEFGRIARKNVGQNLSAMTAGYSDLADAVAHSVDTGVFKTAAQLRGVLKDVREVAEAVTAGDADKFAEMLRDITQKWRSTKGANFSRGIWYQFEATAALVRRNVLDPATAQLDYKQVIGNDPSRWIYQLDIYVPNLNQIFDPKSYSDPLKKTGSLVKQMINHIAGTGATKYTWIAPNGATANFRDQMQEVLRSRFPNRNIVLDVISDIPDILL